MYPQFAVPDSPSPSVPASSAPGISVHHLLTHNLAEIVREMPMDKPVEIRRVAGQRVLVIRDRDLFKTLADAEYLGRGPSHDQVRRIFGADTLFMLPAGEKHEQKKSELKSWLNKNRIEAMLPGISAEAASVVDGMLAQPAASTDMDAWVLRYLFAVAGQAIAGVPVQLGGRVAAFQAGMATILSSASSTVQLALASVSRLFGHLLAGPAREAAEGMFTIGRTLLCEGARNPQDNLARAMLRRHGIEPDTVCRQAAFPQELLYDVSMTFAASIFTTSNLVLGVIHHFCREPEQLRLLRVAMDTDFPGGVRNLKQLTVNPTLRTLWPVMVQQSSVDLVVRDALAAGGFQDRAGMHYAVQKGDIVVFDLAGTKNR